MRKCLETEFPKADIPSQAINMHFETAISSQADIPPMTCFFPTTVTLSIAISFLKSMHSLIGLFFIKEASLPELRESKIVEILIGKNGDKDVNLLKMLKKRLAEFTKNKIITTNSVTIISKTRWPVSRVLSLENQGRGIHLGRQSPNASCDRPG